jgi:glutaredoxin
MFWRDTEGIKNMAKTAYIYKNQEAAFCPACNAVKGALEEAGYAIKEIDFYMAKLKDKSLIEQAVKQKVAPVIRINGVFINPANAIKKDFSELENNK